MPDFHFLKIKNYLAPLLVVICLVFIRVQYGVLLFHTLAELFSIIVGVLMLVIAWNTKQFTHNDFLLYLGIGYFWVAVIDTWHTFTVNGMPFFNITDSEATLHFWISARFIEATILLSAVLFQKRKLSAGWMFIVGAVLALLVIWGSFALAYPVMLTAEGLTPFKVNTEYLVIAMLCLSVFIYFRQNRMISHNVRYLLIISIVLTILAEISFTLYTDFFGNAFVVGHLFKFLSFWLIYQAIVETTLTEPFTVMAQGSSSYDAIPHPAVVVDEYGIISQVNRAAEIHCGSSAQDLIHRHVHNFFHPPHLSVQNCDLCKFIRNGKSKEGLITDFPKDNKSFLISLAPIKQDSKTRAMVQSMLDVTEQITVASDLQQEISDRKLIEASLIKSEVRFRNLFENSEISIWDEDISEVYEILNELKKEGVTDLSEYLEQHPDVIGQLAAKVKVNHVNSATLKLFKATHEKKFINQIDKSFGPGAMEVFVDTMHAYWNNKPFFRSEANFRTLDGDIINAIISYRIPTDPEELKNIAVTIVDITERKQAENKLIQSETRFREIFETTDAISVQGYDRNRKVIYWNSASESLYGFSADEALGKQLEDLIIPEEMRDPVKEGVDNWLNGGAAIPSSELTLCKSDGSAVQVFSNHVLLMNHNNEAEMFCIDMDMTTIKKAERKLIESEGKFKAITDQATEGITVADMDGNYMFVNAAFCQMIGYSEEELLQMSVYDVKAPEQDTSSFERTKGREEGLEVEVYLQRKDGSIFIAEVIGKVIEFGGQTQVLGTIRDITRQVKADEQIRTLSQTVEQSPVSVVITDSQAKIEYVNKTFEKVTGYSAQEVSGLNPRILKSEKTPGSLYKEMWGAISNGKTWQGELQNRKKNGDVFWEYAHFAPVVDEYGTTRHYLAIKEDITLRKQQEEHIIHQAHFDTLTNLPNRFLSLDRLSQLIKEAQRDDKQIAVLFLDMDDFKKVNDTLGHETGDKLLIEASERLRGIIRSGDTVGRFGGDEFIILLGGLSDSADARPIAENLLNRFRDAFRIDGRELMITLSVGIAVYPGDGENSSELLRNADSAMYHSKELGRNTYTYFTDEMNRDVSRRLALEEQIHGALERGEFSVYYQPQINIKNAKVMGAEALLRWFNPALGQVSPVEFIPIAEQTGLIVPLGKFVLTEALTQTELWQKQFDANFRIAVNLSPRQFRDPDLVTSIEQIL
ncbi:MAG: PAS domain S-box protein, partial [Gammaproteobacteria bacterium]|nr:PAS domain S-box protein [Gammaproteobacteria bacterium]